MISQKISTYNLLGNIHETVRVDDFCILSGNVDICSYTHIGAFGILSGTNGGIKIGKFCGISSRVSIFTGTEDYLANRSGNPTLDLSKRDVKYAPVVIEDYVLIGSGVIILPGVTIAEGASIAAGTIINKDVPRGAIVGPTSKAKIFGYRDVKLIRKSTF